MFSFFRCGLLLCLLAACPRVFAQGAKPKPGAAPAGVGSYVLHSTEPFHAVHVPVTVREGEVRVSVTIDRKTQEWLFDTGSTAMSWSRGPAIKGIETGWQNFSHEAFGKKHPQFYTVIPQITMGGYERRQVPGYAVQLTAAEQSEVEQKGRPRLLSSAVFAGVVVTLDYARSELIIRSPDYNPAASLSKAGRAFSFRRLSPDPQHAYGWLALDATIAGKPFALAVDTGFSADPFGLALSQKKFDQILPALKAQNRDFTVEKATTNAATLSGTTEAAMQFTSTIPFTVGKPAALPMKTAILKVSDNLPLIDGVLGWSVLHDYRITFDYARQKIIFEPAAPIMPQ